MNTSEEEYLHRKRLAQILRYIASWNQALGDSAQDHAFVRNTTSTNDFFQDSVTNAAAEEAVCGVLFCTRNFQKLLAWEEQEKLFSSPPFSFYAAAVSDDALRKTSLAGKLKSSLSSPKSNVSSAGYWLRLTRLTRSHRVPEPQPTHAEVKTFLQDCVRRTPTSRVSTAYQEVLSSTSRIDHLLSSNPARPVKVFLKKYKTYILKNRYQQTLEPIYNRLFEWVQEQDQTQELVWSLGHCKFSDPDHGVYIDGPLLDILVEVELAPDGALLLKPRQHTGVALNRQVVSALTNSQEKLAKWHRHVAELEASQFSPGQPSTYVPILKQLALELCPGGRFQAASKKTKSETQEPLSLVVSEAWCLYTRLKPSSVWARDATMLADNIAKKNDVFELPVAAWSLTHGPTTLEEVNTQRKLSQQPKKSFWRWLNLKDISASDQHKPRPMFPLETSDSQNRIAELLLEQHYPAVVTEGPPGTGKTHSIANLVCAYLCQGKRVLVTSKNAPALSVLRGRLPKSVQELCVDVSKSESSGMRQLQKTVERLANRVSVASSEVENQKTALLQKSIRDLEVKLQTIETSITSQNERIRKLMQRPEGVKLGDLAVGVLEKAPWVLLSIESMSEDDFKVIKSRLEEMKLVDPRILEVDNFEKPPNTELLSMVLAKAGLSLSSSLAQTSKSWISRLPVVGSVTGLDSKRNETLELMKQITYEGSSPSTKEHWQCIARALKHSQTVASFTANVWTPKVELAGWPEYDFAIPQNVSEVIEILDAAISIKRAGASLGASQEIQSMALCRSLDIQRVKLVSQIRHHASELVDAAVVAELSKSFSPDAESALIRFAQIAGANKFGKSAKPSKMTQRQRRRRQEYLDAFDKCCRFIPCWIATTSQISDYLPPECLFDLVVIDEASQSDVTVLPGMLRGKQWLIVGDGKQVSPTEAFVSEEDIDNLRASLPHSPFERSLMPGQSFFDLCAQAFPRGRVVLSEHFRCAPDIIDFSNQQFYDCRLVPLRLPLQSERLEPCLVDVRVNGRKTGKVNEVEADKIVELIQEYMKLPGNPRSIGVISLIGDEQSRLIRGRLLDAIGPEQMARHNILIGDPPTFQGAERDIVLLSMVCSRGSVPTQSQLMHFQRANVAMSRARDRCVLVRSIDLTDIGSMDDMKAPMIEFFIQGSHLDDASVTSSKEGNSKAKERQGATLLKRLLQDRGYTVQDMGVIWKNGFCVENGHCRAALQVDGEEFSNEEWQASYEQQKAIERVGWKCYRVDALSLYLNLRTSLDQVRHFLKSAGIEKPLQQSQTPVMEPSSEDVPEEKMSEDEEDVIEVVAPNPVDHDVVTISSSSEDDAKPEARPRRNVRSMNTFAHNDDDDDMMDDAGRFGEVVDLGFLRERQESLEELDDDMQSMDEDVKESRAKVKREDTVSALPPLNGSSDEDESSIHAAGSAKKSSPGKYRRLNKRKEKNAEVSNVPSAQNDSSDDEASVQESDEDFIAPENDEEEDENSGHDSDDTETRKRKKAKKNKKVDKYSRDARWYPGKQKMEDIECVYDTDSDLPKVETVDDGSHEQKIKRETL